MRPWSQAMHDALYGPDGFYARQEPSRHFRTSAQSPLFASAAAELLRRVDAALGCPAEFTVVDMGAGDGTLATNLLQTENLEGRLRVVAVELRPRPDTLDARIQWQDQPPDSVTGVVLACEWLDNIPIDTARLGADGTPRIELVDPATGDTAPGDLLDADSTRWLHKWWPLHDRDDRAEIGLPRDRAWTDLSARLQRGLALAVDYGHLTPTRPRAGTLAGYVAGRQVPPIPDGSRDVTAHVAMDSLGPGRLLTQRDAMQQLGLDASRPPLAEAHRDPAGYVRKLSIAGQAAELIDPAGLGAHHWLLHAKTIPPPL